MIDYVAVHWILLYFGLSICCEAIFCFSAVFYKRRRDNIRSAAERLVAACENDLETDIYDEFVQFHKLLKTVLGKPVVEPHQSAVSAELRM